MIMKNKGILRSGMFYVEHLRPENTADLTDIEDFSIDAPEGQGLDIYLKNCACLDEQNREMRTYLVRDMQTDELVGYFSLKAGLISLNETEAEIEDAKTGKHQSIREFDTLPGVELANFAVNSNYVHTYPYLKGVGHVIFTEFILPLIDEVSSYIGVRMIYIFALPYDKLINRYERYGFKRLPEEQENDLHRRLKPRYDESCKFMYLLLQ